MTTLNSELVSADSQSVVTRGDTVTITSILLQNGSYGNPVPNQMILFFDQTFNTHIGSKLTDANGIASISWIIPLDHALGPTTLNATFLGNESLSLAPSCQRTNLLVVASTNIETSQVPDSLVPEDFLSFTVHLTDDTDNPISNATVKVLKDETLLAVRTTDFSGIVFFEIECNSSWAILGDNEIRVVFEQDLVNYLAASESTFIIEMVQIATSLALHSSHSMEFTLNEIDDLYFEISSINGSLSNEPLQLLLDRVPILQAISNSSGIAHFNLNIDERFMLGFHTLTIQFNGTERYVESYFETIISVKSPVQMTIDTSESFEIGSNVDIEITISDILGRSIPSSLISITDITSSQTFTIQSSSTEDITFFQYELKGPSGFHTIEIEIIDNSFITNGTANIIFSAWSLAEIILLNCNVEHYAFPGQEVFLEIQMTDWAGNCSSKLLNLLIDDENYRSAVTDAMGRANFSFSVPYIENQYNISIFYGGNDTLFESPVNYYYNLQITSLIPSRLELILYKIKSPLNELSVHLILKGLNGSVLKGIEVSFEWLDTGFESISQEGGLIVLSLKVPPTSGNYVLFYESKESSFVASTWGSFLIEVSVSDIMSLQGVGITGLTVALSVSIGISLIPIIRRKHLVG